MFLPHQKRFIQCLLWEEGDEPPEEPDQRRYRNETMARTRGEKFRLLFVSVALLMLFVSFLYDFLTRNYLPLFFSTVVLFLGYRGFDAWVYSQEHRHLRHTGEKHPPSPDSLCPHQGEKSAMMIQTADRRGIGRYLSTFPSMEILSSGNRLPKRLEWLGEDPYSLVFTLMYSNGNSSLFAKEQRGHLNCFISPNVFRDHYFYRQTRNNHLRGSSPCTKMLSRSCQGFSSISLSPAFLISFLISLW